MWVQRYKYLVFYQQNKWSLCFFFNKILLAKAIFYWKKTTTCKLHINILLNVVTCSFRWNRILLHLAWFLRRQRYVMWCQCHVIKDPRCTSKVWSVELADADTIAHIICTWSNDVDMHKVSEYDQEIPQSHTTDKPIAPWGRVTEHLQ